MPRYHFEDQGPLKICDGRHEITEIGGKNKKASTQQLSLSSLQHSPPQSTSSSFPFFDLPRELRDQIYHYVWLGKCMILTESHVKFHVDYMRKQPRDISTSTCHNSNALGWIRASKQLRCESFCQFYKYAHCTSFSQFPGNNNIVGLIPIYWFGKVQRMDLFMKVTFHFDNIEGERDRKRFTIRPKLDLLISHLQTLRLQSQPLPFKEVNLKVSLRNIPSFYVPGTMNLEPGCCVDFSSLLVFGTGMERVGIVIGYPGLHMMIPRYNRTIITINWGNETSGRVTVRNTVVPRLQLELARVGKLMVGGEDEDVEEMSQMGWTEEEREDVWSWYLEVRRDVLIQPTIVAPRA
ncbi:uncharacterized protein BDR25DRAFT_347185 [Lindgomyces ingoldianus]|uniref:Uncharacterized protein n=1 Tax=Lindgomyces ingoldianus TaxID=673940 RepID=A0ACB6Q9H9_9PLEO|nr:uncharacterized protein BDR25DRAFT_347185 [Lindgomyces ingoldianus]KAF2463562.1 hypothetical protein BDR25DRAFT_347185 [Lindgomyces ingoldianus]